MEHMEQLSSSVLNDFMHLGIASALKDNPSVQPHSGFTINNKSNMALEDRLPVQVDLSRKRILKEEINLQSLIQQVSQCDGTYEDLSRLSTVARNTLQSIRSGIEEVRLLCNEEGISADDIIKQHKENFTILQASLRKANLGAEERLQERQKEVLLYGRNTDNVLTKRIRSKEESTKTAAKITEGLLRSAKLMESQIKRSEESTRKLEESSQDIKKTQEEYRGLTGVIGSSKKLISKYTRRELTDTILIFFGLILFFSTVLYIVLKRI